MLALIPDMGPHAAFIWSSYALVVGVLGGLIVWLIRDGASLARRLDAHDARTGRRQPAAPLPDERR